MIISKKRLNQLVDERVSEEQEKRRTREWLDRLENELWKLKEDLKKERAEREEQAKRQESALREWQLNLNKQMDELEAASEKMGEVAAELLERMDKDPVSVKIFGVEDVQEE